MAGSELLWRKTLGLAEKADEILAGAEAASLCDTLNRKIGIQQKIPHPAQPHAADFLARRAANDGLESRIEPLSRYEHFVDELLYAHSIGRALMDRAHGVGD